MSDRETSEPLEAPLDTELSSPRLQFYLRHKANIETWAALRNEVHDATSELMAGLREDFADVATGFGNDASVRYDGEGTRYPRLMLWRSSWPEHDQEATLGIGLEWMAKVDPGGSAPPYYGIRVARTAPGGETLLEALRDVAQAAGAFPKPYTFKGLWWPVYRTMDGDPDWWKDLPAYRQRVLDEVIACWQLSVPLVDEFMARASNAPPRP